MPECPLCGKEIDLSTYLTSAEVHGRDGARLAHIECCSTDDLIILLAGRAQREIEFFQDASHLATNLNIDRIGEFEKKYGNYDELAQAQSDNELAVAAFVAELKRRLLK